MMNPTSIEHKVLVKMLFFFYFGFSIYRLSGQNVGINTDGTIPESNTILDIKSLGTTSSTFGLKIKNSGGTSNFVVRDDGNVGIGTTDLSEKFTVKGRTTLAGLNSRSTVFLASDYTSPVAGEIITDLWFRGQDNLNNLHGYALIETNAITLDDGMEDGMLRFFASNAGTLREYIQIRGHDNSIRFFTGDQDRMFITSGGNVGIGTTGPSASLSVNGAANNTTGVWGVFSDARIKTVDSEFTDGLEVIKKIRPVKFHYNENAPFYSDEQQIGIVAQELEQVAPYMVNRMVHEDFKDLREVNSQAYIFLLINAIKEQQQIIEDQETKIENIRIEASNEINQNRKELSELRKMINSLLEEPVVSGTELKF